MILKFYYFFKKELAVIIYKWGLYMGIYGG